MPTIRLNFIAPILLVTVPIIHCLAIASADHHSADFAPSPMVLPLYHSLPNATMQQRRDASSRMIMRRSLKMENARMRLYDNLLTDGYYTTRLGIGTPPQEFALIVDTGSTVTYVPCWNCRECGRHQVATEQM